jgi:mRNA-degrading endonuclease RelE of RelBE toxin-antitoxin system
MTLKWKKMIFEDLPEFKKDLKTLLKKYRTLTEDLSIVKKVLMISPEERPPFSFLIDGLGLSTCVIKVKKIACKSLKGRGVNSGLRLIYAHFKTEEKIIFIEIYHKNDKASEDRQRIIDNFL